MQGKRSSALIIDKTPSSRKLLLLIESAALVGDVPRILVDIYNTQTQSSEVIQRVGEINKTYDALIEEKSKYETAVMERDKLDEELEIKKHPKRQINRLKFLLSSLAKSRKADEAESITEKTLRERKEALEAMLPISPNEIHALEEKWKSLEAKCMKMDSEVTKLQDRLNEQYSFILFGKKVGKRDPIPSEISPEIITHFRNMGIDIIIYRSPATAVGVSERCVLDKPDVLFDKIKALPNNANYACVVIGGGHGVKGFYMSGFDNQNLKRVVTELENKKIQANLLCLGSCQCISFAPQVSTLLSSQDSAVVSYQENCTDAFIFSSLQYVLGKSETLLDLHNLSSQGNRVELPAIRFKKGDIIQLETFKDVSGHLVVEDETETYTRRKIIRLNKEIAKALPPSSVPQLIDVPISPPEVSTLVRRQGSEALPQESDDKTKVKSTKLK